MAAFAGNSLLCRLALKQTGIDAASFTAIRLVSGALVLWADEGTYVEWDQTLAAGANLKASWALSAPTWEAFGTTKAAAAGQVFQVRLTVAVNGADQVVAGQATVVSPPAITEPMVKT